MHRGTSVQIVHKYAAADIINEDISHTQSEMHKLNVFDVWKVEITFDIAIRYKKQLIVPMFEVKS